MAENGPFGTPFLTPKIPPKKFMWVSFWRSFPGNEAHQLCSGAQTQEPKKNPKAQKSHEQHQRIFWTIRGGYRSLPKLAIKQGFEANRARKFARKLGEISVAKALWGTFYVPDKMGGFGWQPKSLCWKSLMCGFSVIQYDRAKGPLYNGSAPRPPLKI